MKLIIDVDEDNYKAICSDKGYSYANTMWWIIRNGTPYNQSGDLISRSALLNQIDTTDWSDVRLLVEDAPTVEPERPQGEWIQTEVIDDDSEYGVNGDASECSNCKHIENSHYWTTTYYNFCPHCGADMRKGGAEYVRY